jgi:hypothetical protein
MVARRWDASVFLHDRSQENRTRATMKALSTSAPPPSPLRNTYPHFIGLIRMRADQAAVGAVNRPLRMARVFCKCASGSCYNG